MRRHPLLVALVCLVVGMGGLFLFPFAKLAAFLPTPALILSQGLWRFILGAVMVAAIALMGGGGALKSVGDFGWTMKKCIYVLVVNVLMGALATLGSIDPQHLPAGLLAQEIIYLLFCLSVGIFEEGLFRGVIFGALQKKMGRTRAGLAGAAVLSALIFGVVHVIDYIFGGSYDAMGVAQSVMKTLQAAELGFLFAVLYAKGKSLWALALVHALVDFFPIQSTIFSGQQIGNYVAQGEQGAVMIGAYIFLLLLYLPLVITGVGVLRKIELPQRGVFGEDRDPGDNP